jgi:hypothetical protein
MASDSGLLGGLSVRVHRRVRLGVDVSYPGEPRSDAVFAVAVSGPPSSGSLPERRAAGRTDEPVADLWVSRVGVEGWFGRFGAEVALPFRTPVFVRTGLERNQGSNRFTFGAGTVLGTRLQIDAAAGVRDGDWRGIVTLSLRL